jgi:hypothetical protein
VQCFPKTQAYVHNAQTSNGASEVVIENEITKRREITEKKVVFPILGPRKDNEEKAELKTEKDENDHQDLVSHESDSLSSQFSLIHPDN